MREYTRAHREEHNARGRAWRNTEAGRRYYREYQRKRRQGLPVETLRAEQKKSNLIARYDITIEQYGVMVSKYDGGCWICGRKPPFGRIKYLCVDHDHSTGMVRGLLCSHCNSFLGRIKDDATKVTKYLSAR